MHGPHPIADCVACPASTTGFCRSPRQVGKQFNLLLCTAWHRVTASGLTHVRHAKHDVRRPILRHHWQTSDRAATFRRVVTAICCGYGSDAPIIVHPQSQIAMQFQQFYPVRHAHGPVEESPQVHSLQLFVWRSIPTLVLNPFASTHADDDAHCRTLPLGALDVEASRLRRLVSDMTPCSVSSASPSSVMPPCRQASRVMQDGSPAAVRA
jgi:hypothetical protein